MKKQMFSLVCALFMASGMVFAQDNGGECPAGGTCPAGGCPAQTETVSAQTPETQEPAASAHQEHAHHSHDVVGDPNCPITQGMKKLPVIHYMVGEERACCAGSAATMAKAKSLPIVYKVGDDAFDSEETAYVKLVEVTEKFVNDFATPCKCEVSGKTTIAGETCDCPVKAGEKTELVKAAMEKVSLTYKVGKETCGCPVTAKEMAAKAGETVSYVVGDEECGCEYQARLMVAHAKYKAALAALHTSTGAAPAAQTLTSEKIN